MKKLNTPLPQPLPKECEKAAKIFQSFVDSRNNGLDGVIPRQVLERAKGFAIFTIIKAGFLFSARAGSGVVIARLDDGSWSAPSAIGTAGLGVGGQIGAEMTDFLVVLNSRSAVRSFMSAGSLTLGGNMSIALGPLGRNGEASGALNTNGKVAAMYSYSKTRGLFGGVSVEGSIIVERQDANALAYNSDVTAKMLLGGAVDTPDFALPLIRTIEACIGMPGGHKWVDDSEPVSDGSSPYAFGKGMESPGSESGPSASRGSLPSHLKTKRNNSIASFPPAVWGKRKDDGSYFADDAKEGNGRGSVEIPRIDHFQDNPTKDFTTKFESDFSPEDSFSHTFRQRNLAPSKEKSTYAPGSPFNDLPPFPRAAVRSGLTHNRAFSEAVPKSSNYSGNPSSRSFDPFAYDNLDDGPSASSTVAPAAASHMNPYIAPKVDLPTPLRPHDGVGRAIALYNFNAVEIGDLSFKKGEVITITEKTDSINDWWTGRLDGREGIFPANFVEVV